MNRFLVSIIIPVYNGEKFIDECLKKILKQTYENIEIIVINDGSTDETKNILKKYSLNKKIKIFNNENHGVSYGRNYGIEKATGDYIMFLDVDDELLDDAIEQLVDYVNKNNDIDIIRFNGYEEHKDKTKSPFDSIDKYNNLEFSKENTLNLFVTGTRPIRGYSWLLFLKNRDILPFKINLKYLEDTVFCIENFTNNKKVYFYDKPLYIYKYNESSVTKSYKNICQNLNNILDSHDEIKKYIDGLDNKYLRKLNIWFGKLLIRRICIISRWVDYKTFKDLCDTIHEDERVINYLKQKNLSIDDKKLLIQLRLFLKKLYRIIYMINIVKK